MWLVKHRKGINLFWWIGVPKKLLNIEKIFKVGISTKVHPSISAYIWGVSRNGKRKKNEYGYTQGKWEAKQLASSLSADAE